MTEDSSHYAATGGILSEQSKGLFFQPSLNRRETKNPGFHHAHAKAIERCEVHRIRDSSRGNVLTRARVARGFVLAAAPRLTRPLSLD